MADVDVKQLMLQVDASVELLRANLMRGDREVTRFTTETQRRLDATDRRFAQLGRPLNQIASGVARTNAQIATIGATATRVQAQVTAASNGIRTALLTSTSGIAAAFGANQVADYADGYTRFTNQLKVAGLEGVHLGDTQERLYVIAQKYGVQLENLGRLYGGLTSLQKDLNTSNSDSIALTQAVAASIKVGGVSAEQSAGAILGLNQALAQTRVQSDEYNQILDGARPLLQAAVNGTEKYGGSLAKLKQDIEAGNVSGSHLFKILANGFDNINAQAEKSTLTIGNSFTVLNNALGKYIGEAGEASTATEKISTGIQGIANNLDLIGPALAVIGAGFATRASLPALSKARDEVSLFIKALDDEKVVMLGSKVAAAQKAQAVAAAARAEVSAIEATIATRRADAEAIAANLVLIDRQRDAALQAQAAMRANAAAGFGTIGLGRGVEDAGRANQDLKAQIVTKRALATANAEIAASEVALDAAKARAAIATTAATAATNAATLSARACAAANRLLAGSLTLIGGSVAGGAAVLAIGAVVSAVMLYQNSVAEAKRRDEEFVQSGKDLNEHLRQTAQYASHAAGGVTNVGSSAAGAVSGMNGMATSAANLADNLRKVAEEARRAAIEMLRTDEKKA
ncbi:MAG: tape measure protein, partial [Pseudomonadota bacterium]|nr:tape measure protein [Pseudomonadota bacterium]